MTTIALNLCYACEHYTGAQTCTAFPVIPDDIWENRFDHRYPHEGDHGKQFSILPGMDDHLEAWAEQNPELAN